MKELEFLTKRKEKYIVSERLENWENYNPNESTEFKIASSEDLSEDFPLNHF